MVAKLDDEVKQFEAEYKKCRVISKGGVKDVEKYTKRIKYYRYDMLMGLEDLEEEVAAHKCGTDPIDAKKIDDYAQDKKFRNLLKGINWNYAKLEKACEKLERQEKDAVIAANEKKLKNLKVKIAKDLTKRKKEKTPSKTAIEKLEKQVNDDLELLDELRVLFEKNPVSLIGVKKEFEDKSKKILAVKPRVSASQKKYKDIHPKKLVKNKLRDAISEFKDASKELKNQAKEMVDFAKKKQVKEMTENLENGQKQLKIIETLAQEYSDIKKGCQKEINDAPDGNTIEKVIKYIVKGKKEAVKEWDKAIADVKKAKA